MANDKNNINELVTDDDDPTVELEAIVLHPSDQAAELEAAASTAGFSDAVDVDDIGAADVLALQVDLQSRAETINHLQFDLAQLQAKWLGLEAEIESRERVKNQLHVELDAANASLQRKQELLKKRDLKIKTQRQEIRDRNETHQRLLEQFENLNKYLASVGSEQPQDEHGVRVGQLASSELAIREWQQRYRRVEEYADQLRQQLQDRQTETDIANNTSDFMQQSLLHANDRIAALEETIAELSAQNTELNDTLAALGAKHADEIRIIRFELGEAQETVSQHELLTEQLASDLVETRTYRFELENMLSENEESHKSRIEKLEKENRGLRRETSDLQQKLDTKNEAINCLISELAKRSQQADSNGEVEDVIHDINERISERIDNQSPVERDRVTRVLIGSIDNQELRFPLFKDRLTIGRTEQNDIQLKATHISRRHAVIVTEGTATRVIDWGSKNGVFVNAKRITEHFLKNGDIVSVGTSDFRYEERAKRDP